LARILTALIVFLLGVPAFALNRSLLDEMPSVAKVRSSVNGSEASDTAARQAGAFRILSTLVGDLSEGRDVTNRLTQQEKALMAEYWQASDAAISKGNALLVEKGAPKTGPDAPGPTMVRASERYQYDPRFKQEVLKTFFRPSFIESYEAAMSARARVREGGSRGNNPARSSAPKDAGDWLTAGGELLLRELGASGVLVGLALAVLFGLTYPLIAFLRSRRVALWSVAGPAIEPRIWTETHTHTTGGYHNANGHWVPSSSYTTSSRNDEFFIQKGDRHHLVSLKNVNFGVVHGHRVTAVWVGTKPKAKRWWVCRVHNLQTGQLATLNHSCRRARGSSFTAATLWTFLFFAPACLAAFLMLGGEHGFMALVLISIVAFSYWFLGGLSMKIFHVFGDRQILARAGREASTLVA
jgi:hypothetical protein